MKVEFTKSGRFVLTAETEHDNTMLFAIINTPKLNGVRMTFQHDSVVSEPKSKETTQVAKRPRVASRVKTCPVEGCGFKSRNLGNHMLYKHGIKNDGTLQDFRIHGGKRIEIAEPVVKLGDGTYKPRPKKASPAFLD